VEKLSEIFAILYLKKSEPAEEWLLIKIKGLFSKLRIMTEI